MIKKKTISGGGTTAVSSYVYDSLDRLVAESHSGSSTSSVYSAVNYQYDLAGNRLSKNKNGLETAYTPGTGNRLASSAGTSNCMLFVSGTSGEPVGTDPRWGILSISNLTAGASVIPGFSADRFYASVPALAGRTNTVIAAVRDQAGNVGYATNDLFVPPVSGTASAQSFEYDAAGCLTNLNGIALEWDERYRLISATSSNASVSYTYDPQGRKMSRTSGSAVEYYVYDGPHIVADLDANKNLLRTYAYGPGIDNILTVTRYSSGNRALATYHYIKDHQNTVIALADKSGSVVESYDYDACGNILDVKDASGTSIGNQKSAIGNRYTFQGREIDRATGLIYFRARWYDPDTGRWLSKDPIGIAGGLNQYVFCGNNPVNFVDPIGTCKKKKFSLKTFLWELLKGLTPGGDIVSYGEGAKTAKGIIEANQRDAERFEKAGIPDPYKGAGGYRSWGVPSRQRK